MRHRLTALVLAFIMASPMCWCGWTHAREAPHSSSCCESQSHGKSGKPDKKDKDCACLQSHKSRELVSVKVKVPPPSLDFTLQPALPMVEALTAPRAHVFTLMELCNHGPPKKPRPLYHLDCALLI